jgi:ATP-dependent DNA helicase DinG
MPGSNKAIVDALERLSESAIASLREAIASNAGCEVFAIGTMDGVGLIDSVEIVARGTDDTVPALGGYFEKGSVLIHNHPSGTLRPSDADVAVAAEAGSFGVGSFIVDNPVEKLFVIAEPARKKAWKMLDSAGLAGALDSGGKLSLKMRTFEPRDSQIQMTADVADIFNSGGILAAEAGTGVGKSFAYLIPAIGWALGNDERVVISTATINLQDQLYAKDIPLVASIFKKPVKAVLVKGRANYLCGRRLAEALEEEGLLADADHPLRKLKAWEESGGGGDRADISFRVEDAVWNRVCSEADYCLSLRCPLREKCHVIAVRKEAADAQIVVVNHHLLFADIQARKRGSGVEQTSILPAYTALVLDEAHSLESSATSLFSESFSRFTVAKKLSRLRRKSRAGEFGVAAKLAALQKPKARDIPGLDLALKEVLSRMSDLEASALGLIGSENSFRLREKNPDIESRICAPAGNLQRSILAVTKILSDAIAALPDDKSGDSAVTDARLAVRSLNDLADLAARLKDFDSNPDSVAWMEKTRSSQREIFLTFTSTPLDVSVLLERTVFDKVRTVVCTSATLSVGGSFAYWMKRAGIDQKREDVEAKTYLSPFPFSSNAVLAIDKGAPHPQNAKERFREYVCDAVIRLLAASRGRALVLFTSYELLAASYEKAKPFLDGLGITCLRQGMDDRSRLLSMFRNDISSVLFATDSFWEGVDAPGETLSMVVISKLPFRVPVDPVQQARAEAVEKAGGNSFMEISVPEAIIKFKQGFGRLIRHTEDRGVAVVLDQRLATARYGNLFVESLPKCRLICDSLTVIEKAVTAFLDD